MSGGLQAVSGLLDQFPDAGGQRTPDSEYSNRTGIVPCPCGCGRDVPPTRKHARHPREYATDACRTRVRNRRLAAELAELRGRQRPLDFALSPLPPVQDQRVDLAEEEKLRGDNALVLRRLRQGPATTADLQAAAPRSMAVHSRVADVRAYLLGLGETVRRRKAGPRLHLYWIEAKR